MQGEHNTTDEQAIDLIRAKLDRIYGHEPDAEQELREVKHEPTKELSKHQRFMQSLQNSGLPVATIQVKWHEYYDSLSDNEKRQVWDEFYAKQLNSAYQKPEAQHHEATILPELAQDTAAIPGQIPTLPGGLSKLPRRKLMRSRLTSSTPGRSIKTQIRRNISLSSNIEKRRIRLKQNLQSLAFGLGVGFVVILIFMFSFFNERFLAPFIHPAIASATPIILDSSSVSPTAAPTIIIPKINVEIPLVFDVGTTNESMILKGLEDGVVHYPTTVLPGQKGNTAFFGHSSNNIFSPGKYKFAFVQLNKLKAGDLFYITYNKKVYVYKVFDRQIVDPSDVGVLDNVPGKISTATLITCDPPGTSLNRLVVWGEQISPDPATSAAAPAPTEVQKPTEIVGNGPSLWDKIWPF